MTSDSPVFLTDERRAVLNGDTDQIADSTERAHRSNIRARSRTALDELVEVAESPRIDNTEVFDPNTMFQLFSALLLPDPSETQGDGVQGGLMGPDDYTDEFAEYSNKLKLQMAKFVVEEPDPSK